MKLYQDLLFEELGTIEKYLMVLEIIDVLDLERGHPYFPDDTTGRGPELDILGRDKRFGQIRGKMFHCQYLVRKIEIVLVDEAAVKTLSLLV
jgi:hypothetical protein